MTLTPFRAIRPGTGLTATDNGDGTVTFDAAGTGIPTDGWVAAGVTWTYASTTTFTVSGDLTALFSKGTRIKLTQTTVKYFVVVGSSHSSGTTTVTVTGGSDYSLANAAITDPYFSYVVNPEGYPLWFNFATQATGFTGALATDLGKFQVHNGVCWVQYLIDGTSNATTFTWELPITCVQGFLVPVYVTNNSAVPTTPGRAFPASSSKTVTMGLNMSANGGFNSSNSKGSYGTFAYPI